MVPYPVLNATERMVLDFVKVRPMLKKMVMNNPNQVNKEVF
jgi:hypothetical protein